MDTITTFMTEQENLFRSQMSSGMKLFPQPIFLSTMLNAGPPVLSFRKLLTYLGTSKQRSALLDTLSGALDEMRQTGASPEFILFGGSFLLLELEPNDLDCIVFYKALEGRTISISDLVKLQTTIKKELIDARFVALDVDQAFYLKALSFYTLLYSQSRPGKQCAGCVIAIVNPTENRSAGEAIVHE